MNTEDERIKALDTEKASALNTQNAVYDNLMTQNEELLNKQNSWQDTYQAQQETVIDKQASLTTSTLENKQAANETAYQKEAAASESSYQKAINPYGVQAEQTQASGLQNSGYSETTKMMAYNTAKNRTATARASKVAADTEYQTAIAEAQLGYDTQKATLALELLQNKLENELTAFQTTSALAQNKLATTTATDTNYYNRYQDVISQQNYEQEVATQLEQYERQLAYQKERDRISDKQYEASLAQARKEAAQAQANWEAEYNASYNTSKSEEELTGSSSIQTDYYSGPINPDTANGTFDIKDANGINFIPDNVNGNKLSGSEKTVSQIFGKGNTGSGGENIDNQQVWKAKGNYYIWDNANNEFADVTAQVYLYGG